MVHGLRGGRWTVDCWTFIIMGAYCFSFFPPVYRPEVPSRKKRKERKETHAEQLEPALIGLSAIGHRPVIVPGTRNSNQHMPVMSVTAVEHGSDDAAPLVQPTPGGGSSSAIMPLELQRFGSHLSRYKDRITLDTLRPLPVFLGVTGPSFCISAQAFAPPSKRFDKDAAEKIGSRLKLNFAFFLSNYALIVGGTAFVVALMHPAMLVLMGIVYGLWYVHFLIERAGMAMEYGGIDFGEVFTTSRRAFVLTIITILVGMFKCLVPLLEVLAISGIVILAHASMRDPQHVESCGDFVGGAGGGARRHGSADSDDDDEEYVLDDDTTGIISSKDEKNGELIRRDVV